MTREEAIKRLVAIAAEVYWDASYYATDGPDRQFYRVRTSLIDDELMPALRALAEGAGYLAELNATGGDVGGEMSEWRSLS